MLSEPLRQAIRDSRLSLQEIGRRAKVAPSQLSLFLKGERSLRLDTAERLALVLGAFRPDSPAYILVAVSPDRFRVARRTGSIEDAPSDEYQFVSPPFRYVRAREELLIRYGM